MRKTTNKKRLVQVERRHRWKLASASLLFLALIITLWLTPKLVDARHEIQAAIQHAWDLQAAREAAVAEAIRVEKEKAVMKEFNALRLTLYCEAQSYNEADMLAIADNVFSRVDSPAYPDTIYEVVNERRISAETGKKVAMYSYIDSDCPTSKKLSGMWQLSGAMTAIALKQRWEGKPSSGNVNYHAPYVNPVWATKDVERCILKPVETPGTFHAFYASVSVDERPSCLAEHKARRQQEAEMNRIIADSSIVLPINVPVPKPRPHA